MKYQLSKNAGFCFGVKRTLAMVEDNFNKMKMPVLMYGHLVHNEEVVKKLIEKGIKVVEDLTDVKNGTLIITAHGISPKIKERLENKKELDIIDTTCPRVLRVQNLAKELYEEGNQVLIFGDSDHREVKGIFGATSNNAIIFSSKEELGKIKFNKNKKYGLVVQTTKDLQKFREVERKLKRKIPKLKVFNTICGTSKERQVEARKLAKTSDLMIVVGSKTSSNTTRLYEISSKINLKTYFIGTEKELKKSWFKNANNVGITAGASTPDWVIEGVVKKISSY